jgi:hypothetical protein
MRLLFAVSALCAMALLGEVAQAQAPPAADKPSVGKYMAEGYEVLRAEIGNPFLQFLLKKDQALVWCSVQLSTGETSSCRTIK